jgi:hypothetical protein
MHQLEFLTLSMIKALRPLDNVKDIMITSDRSDLDFLQDLENLHKRINLLSNETTLFEDE